MSRPRRFLHLSPQGRGRIASSDAIRVRGVRRQSYRKSNPSVPSITLSTPSRLSYTSLFETRTMWKPQASSTLDRASSRARSDASACVTQSTSTMSFPSSVTKSTTYRSIGCWRRNFQRASRRLRKACQSFASALVCDSRSFLALALNLCILSRERACGSPSPGCCAADLSPQGRGKIAQAIRARGLPAHPDLAVLYPSRRTGNATNSELHPRLPLTRPLRGRPLPTGERCSTAAAAS